MIDPEKLVRGRIRELAAYHVEQAPCPVILDANESPYPLPEALGARVNRAMTGMALNRYPDMEVKRLREAIALKEGAKLDEVLAGNGSDEIIQALIATLCEPGSCILTPAPTFVMFKSIAHYMSVNTVEVPLEDDWTLDMDAMAAQIEKHQPRIVFVASPNNPTGMKYSRFATEAVIEAAPGAVVIDEAYIDFAREPVGLVYRDRPNVVILRTLSKIGLAAARLGYMLADARLVEQVNKVRLPYNINTLTQTVAAEVVENYGELTPMFRAIVSERERMFDELEKMEGVTPFPSEANFIFMRVAANPDIVFDSILRDGIRVRWRKGDERLGDCFRVTVGTPEENNLFIASLRKTMP